MTPRQGRNPFAPILFLVTSLLLTLPALAFQVGLPPLLGTEDLDKSDRESLENAVRDELLAAFPAEEWTLMPGDLLALALEGKDLDPSTCAEEACFAEMGRAVGLDILIMGYFRRSSNEDRLLLKLYDVASGKMEGFIRVSGSEPRALRSSLPEDCRRLLHPYRDWKPAEEVEFAGEDTDLLTEAWAAQSEDATESLVGAEEEVEREPVPPPKKARTPGALISGWGFGTNVSTYSGPNHAVLMNHINNIGSVMGEPISLFQSFEVGTSLGFNVLRHFNGPITFVADYHFTKYSQQASFVPHGWESDRTVESKLHEFGLGIHYALSFVRSKTVEPFVAASVTLLYADSYLDIALDNVSNSPDGNPGTAYPDYDTRIESTDMSVGAAASVGLNYRLNRSLMIQGQLGGTMGQVSQYFDYEGSLQHITPDANQSEIEDPSVNDILWGSYPLELNGLRLSLGLLVTL